MIYISSLIEPPQQQNDPVTVNNNPNQKNDTEIPPESTKMELEKEDSNHNNANQNKSNKLVWVNFIVQTTLTIATIGAFFAAAYYANIAKQTLDEIKDQTGSVKVGAEAAKSAANTASNSLVLAERSINATQEQFRLDQRAWVNIVEAKFREPFDAQKNSHIDFAITNSGKTPALRVRCHYKIWIKSSGITFPTDEKTQPSEFVLGPGHKETQTVRLGNPISQKDIDALQSGQTIFFIKIKFIYFDIYNAKRPHQTCECLTYDPKFSINMSLSVSEPGCSYMD